MLDLGSGFSTYVLARAIDESGVVVSMDDSQLWLDRTRAFLERNAVRVPDLLLWTGDVDGHSAIYDVVFHDLGNMATRRQALGFAAASVGPSGFLVLDDVHKLRYRFAAYRFLREAGFQVYSVWRATHDSYDRHAWLAQRPAVVA